MRSRKSILFWSILVCFSFVLVSCGPKAPAASAAPVSATHPANATTVPATPTPVLPTATAAPKSLVVCLGQEPTTLYPYGGSSRAMWSVLEAIYDGPIDTVNFQPKPVILKKLPAFNDGAVIESVDVKSGDTIVDASGSVTTLAAGMRIAPSGCYGPDCATQYDGTSPLKMDHLKLTYQLLPGLKWSDGAPLTAADSQYSYELSKDPATPVSRKYIARTASYKAIDDQTVTWTGLPGYVPQSFENFFWMPLPEHLWKSMDASALLTTDMAVRSPVGWGPYKIYEWVQGDHIQLVKNPNYFRASEGLPKFDTLVFRFLGEPADNNITALLTKECDVVDQTSLLDEQLEMVLDLQQSGKLKAFIGQGPEWEHLDFGILPAAYDDGYNVTGGDRPDIFGDPRVRQAFAYCSDRQGIVDTVFFGKSSVPNGFIPPSSPLYAKDIKPIAFDPNVGGQLLDAAGWKDADGNPQTARVSQGVKNVPDGTNLMVNYATTKAPVRMAVAQKLVASLAQCGIQVNVQYADPGALYGAGPDGLLFGRKFDLAEFAWDAGVQPACSLYETDQIPTKDNNWLKVNITGYSSPAYDAACEALKMTPPGQTDALAQRLTSVQSIFNQDVPSIPLYFRLKVAIGRPDLCGMDMDVSARSDLWNIESLDYGAACK
jgi:peptide/nickel transport system substrate-binding protein